MNRHVEKFYVCTRTSSKVDLYAQYMIFLGTAFYYDFLFCYLWKSSLTAPVGESLAKGYVEQVVGPKSGCFAYFRHVFRLLTP